MSEKPEIKESSYWQKVFSSSKANDAMYLGEHLPRWPWNWPTGTWLQTKLDQRAKPTEE